MKLPDMVIDFSPEGSVEAMHRDQFALGFLGKQSISRASDIKFDEDSQTWAIHVIIDSVPQPLIDDATGFASYEQARRIEVEWFEKCRLHQVTPVGVIGKKMLRTVRGLSNE